MHAQHEAFGQGYKQLVKPKAAIRPDPLER